MKKTFLTFCFIFLAVVTCNCQSLNSTSKSVDESMEPKLDYCPISLNTTKITYRHHTDSGTAIKTTITIFEDHLVYERRHSRENRNFKYSCEYSKDDFKELILRLSKIQFSVTDGTCHEVGGGGYDYSFESDSGQYLHYDDVSKFTGNYQQVSSLIQQFIEEHQNEKRRFE